MPRYCTNVTVRAFLNDINQVTAENKVTFKNVLGTSQKDEAEILRYHKKDSKILQSVQCEINSERNKQEKTLVSQTQWMPPYDSVPDVRVVRIMPFDEQFSAPLMDTYLI